MSMIKLALIGQNIAYSLSPKLHQGFAKQAGIEIDYQLRDISEAQFELTVRDLQKQGYRGCNITMPFKQRAFAIADRVTDRSKAVGVANTLIFEADGNITADNTDGAGFIHDVTNNLGKSLADKTILICGAGGAVAGILKPILDQKPQQIIIANRTAEKAQVLAIDPMIIGCDYQHIPADIRFDVILDGTSLRTGEFPITQKMGLVKDVWVYDLKYGLGDQAPLFQWAKAQGIAEQFDGLGMLTAQAMLSFAQWTEFLPEKTDQQDC